MKAIALIPGGLDGLLLRPLSAKLLPESVPEKEGWVKKEKLCGFKGRGRRSQIELAESLGMKEYAQPAGGCLLTDPAFSKRLKDTITCGELTLDSVELLKIGRHFRLSPNAKLVVGRDEKEDRELENLAKADDYLFFPNEQLAGPTSLGRGEFNEELIKLSCAITFRYCDLNGKREAAIVYKKVLKVETVPLGMSPYFNVSPLGEDKLITLRV